MARDAKQISEFIVQWLSEQLGQKVGADAEFTALGLDSLDAVRMTDALAAKLSVDELPVSVVLEHPSVSALATHLASLP
ncbi:MAG TPA: acyl carrier protein [Kofleriaceae bacterium]|jgi:acyl carrier protein